MLRILFLFAALVVCLGAFAQDRTTVHFETNSSLLSATALQKLDALVQQLKQCEACALTITGHTDSTASEAHNNALSLHRAKEVYGYLDQAGRISAVRNGCALTHGNDFHAHHINTGLVKIGIHLLCPMQR